MGLFAKELYRVLLAHRNDDYSHLPGGPARQDPIWHPLRLVPIEPPVIFRLKLAAEDPNKMAQLNAHSLAQTVERLGYSQEEYTRLRAALLAESVSVYLRNRMEPKEADIVNTITRTIHEALLTQLRPITELMRSAADVEDTMQVALTMVERAGELADAAEEAAREQNETMAVFWGRLARLAYEQARTLLQDDAPAFAEALTRLIDGLPG